MSPVICDPAKRKTHKHTILQQLRQMQEVLYLQVLDPNTKPVERAQCARAYEVLEERRAIIRMRPAPKPVEVPYRQKRQKSAVQADIMPFADPSTGTGS
jgi:hypothetical protein